MTDEKCIPHKIGEDEVFYSKLRMGPPDRQFYWRMKGGKRITIGLYTSAGRQSVLVCVDTECVLMPSGEFEEAILRMIAVAESPEPVAYGWRSRANGGISVNFADHKAEAIELASDEWEAVAFYAKPLNEEKP